MPLEIWWSKYKFIKSCTGGPIKFEHLANILWANSLKAKTSIAALQCAILAYIVKGLNTRKWIAWNTQNKYIQSETHSSLIWVSFTELNTQRFNWNNWSWLSCEKKTKLRTKIIWKYQKLMRTISCPSGTIEYAAHRGNFMHSYWTLWLIKARLLFYLIDLWMHGVFLHFIHICTWSIEKKEVIHLTLILNYLVQLGQSRPTAGKA